MTYRKYGSLSSSVDPEKFSKTASGIIGALGGALVFLGVASTTDVNTLVGAISQIITLGYTVWSLCETAYGIFRKIAVAVAAKTQRSS